MSKSSFPEGLSWRDGWMVVELGVFTEVYEKVSRECCNNSMLNSGTPRVKNVWFSYYFVGKVHVLNMACQSL